MEEVKMWLRLYGLYELEDRFECQKINTMKRLRGLNEALIKEFVPEVGLRLDLIECLKLEHEVENGDFSSATDKSLFQSEKDELRDLNPLITVPSTTDNQEEIGKKINKPTSSKNVKETEELAVSKESQEITISDEENSANINKESNTNKSQSKKRKRSAGCDENKQNKHLASWSATEFLKNLDLHKYLNEFSITSQIAVENYENNGFLIESDRSHICDAVAEAILRKNFTPGHTEYKTAATKICELFPCESEEIYYNPPDIAHRNAFGKLPNKIKNIKYQLAKQGSGCPSTSGTESTKLKFTEPSQLTGSSDNNDDAVKAAISFLKHESCDSWPVLLKKWSITHAFRNKRLKSSRPTENVVDNAEEQNYIQDYFQEWTILGLANGFSLLDQDFKELFPGKEDGLLARWETRKILIVNLIKKEVAKTDLHTLKLLKDYDAAPEGKRDSIIIHMLPSLLSKRIRRKESSDVTTFAEARISFVLHVKIPGDLQRSVEQHAKKLKNLNLSLQPFIILVGPTLSEISASYVQINGVRYLLRTPIKALDVCFKSHFALDAAYLTPCKAVFYFIQNYFFDIYLKGDEKIQRVSAVISSLRGLGQQQK
ncbi:uncharacterized protein LOC122510795 isoform X1 [Leptopilina heterotoma]|uniref:uncharacterized protein LOC122509278 isoform X1 n=1 Tax=Leptopilina heterotoma TaxID=63436 RepID=UPI001CA95B99|nr:uncharacterized protein LOC122509278 isoform X1 [Leptopilina heterotoma]XP_043481628.1 uncharacterized protein LOC122510795 isoform X1 [Leptopilina heterotoma]